MSFYEFLIKKVLPGFFVSVTCISVAIAVLGMIFFPDAHFGYNAFLSPLIFGLISVFPKLLTYSKKELNLKQVWVRKALHLIMLEAVIIYMNYVGGALISLSLTLSLMLSVLIINVSVHMILWSLDNKTAREFNESLKQWQCEIQGHESTEAK